MTANLPGSPQDESASRVVTSLRTPQAAAVAGLGFMVLALTAGVLLRLAIPLGALDDPTFALDETSYRLARIGAGIVPFAGICFLWFIGVIRVQLGAREDKLFATVFLGSGLLAIAMLFVSTAAAVGLLTLHEAGVAMNSPVAAFAARLWEETLTAYAARMAGVFTIAVTTLGRRTRIIPTWLVVVGYVAGAAMLVAPFGVHYVEALFPVWVGVYSAVAFVHFRDASARESAGRPDVPGESSTS